MGALAPLTYRPPWQHVLSLAYMRLRVLLECLAQEAKMRAVVRMFRIACMPKGIARAAEVIDTRAMRMRARALLQHTTRVGRTYHASALSRFAPRR